MNNITLCGRLTKEPEVKFQASSGMAVCNFTMAVNRPKKKDGTQEADFIRCVAFGKTGEAIAQYVAKGHKLLVNGSLRIGSYEAQDGSKRYTSDVYVSSFEFLESKKDNGFSQKTENSGFSSDFGMELEGDADIPF